MTFFVLRVLILEVSKGRDHHDPFFLLLPVACPYTAATIAGVKVIYQTLEANDEIIVLIECVDVFRCGQNPYVVFTEVVDKQRGLCPVAAKAGEVFDNDRFNLSRFHDLVDTLDALTVEVHTADIVIERLAYHLMAVADGKVIYNFSLVVQRVEFLVLVSGQSVIEPDFHGRPFPLWCAGHHDTL